MNTVTAENLAKAISLLPRNQWFEYVNSRTKTKVRVLDVLLPEGPIRIARYDSAKSSLDTASEATISTQMLWRVANAIVEGIPFNLDRVLGSSYNTRSALETLLVHTREFYWCRPGRIELVRNSSKIESGHKHVIWLPNKPHELGLSMFYNSDQVVSEIPATSAVYEALVYAEAPPSDIDVNRRHLQVQIALAKIGVQIGYRTWIARPDQGFTYGGKRVGQLEGVVSGLNSEAMISGFQGAVNAAMYIDCIWFKNGTLMPAVIEVEHTTGVQSGLDRMLRLFNLLPEYRTRWVIAAPDEDRARVVQLANHPTYKKMRVKFFPYSGVDELYSFCQRRRPTRDAVTDTFLDCFMEDTVNA